VEVVHWIEMVEGYNFVVVMEGGRVVEMGKPGELLSGGGGGKFKELWEGRVGKGE